MKKKSEIQEREYLVEIKKRLHQRLQTVDARIERYEKDVKGEKAALGESKDSMDHLEKVAARDSIKAASTAGEQTVELKNRIAKLIQSPYFGRVDFQGQGSASTEKIYVGIHGFHDDHENKPLVHDWRAPISSLFYDYETGVAQYESPTGIIQGEILLKRQFRIRNGEMEFMLESAVNIVDDFLQKELSRTSDDGMKNIVATIQRDQNTIIRNDHAEVLIIQGVAGSGKTSIALHRISFLLYRFKETLTSEDILIISPNKVFADYISNVLPELGEETVSEMQMETLAAELLGQQYAFQTFFEQTAELLETNDEDFKNRIRIKSSADFVKTLDTYADFVKQNVFVAEDVWVGGCYVPAWLFEEMYEKNSSFERAGCIDNILEILVQKISNEYRYDLKSYERATLKKAISRMHTGRALRETYKDMFLWMEKPELFHLAKHSKIEYADVFPMIYLKMKLEGSLSFSRKVKHLLIDEMQDYTRVQYAVIEALFDCNKTILGDAYQSVNPYTSSDAEGIQNVFPRASYVKLNKSYRSTYEIMHFAQSISPNPELEVIERHGEEPQVLECKDKGSEIEWIVGETDSFSTSGFHTLGIICKTQKQAEALAALLQKAGKIVQLLSKQSTAFQQGIIVCTAHMAKGLEFDQVIVPEATEKNYHTPMDRNLLYVACTRAMHRLSLTHVGKRTPWIPQLVKG